MARTHALGYEHGAVRGKTRRQLADRPCRLSCHKKHIALRDALLRHRRHLLLSPKPLRRRRQAHIASRRVRYRSRFRPGLQQRGQPDGQHHHRAYNQLPPHLPDKGRRGFCRGIFRDCRKQQGLREPEQALCDGNCRERLPDTPRLPDAGGEHHPLQVVL